MADTKNNTNLTFHTLGDNSSLQLRVRKRFVDHLLLKLIRVLYGEPYIVNAVSPVLGSVIEQLTNLIKLAVFNLQGVGCIIALELLSFFVVVSVVRLDIEAGSLDVCRINLPGILQKVSQLGNLGRCSLLGFLRCRRLGFHTNR
ncbi:hypothetical protein D3C81_1759440 [compost metagenome]